MPMTHVQDTCTRNLCRFLYKLVCGIEFYSVTDAQTDGRTEATVIEAGALNTFRSRLKKLYDRDESVFGRYSFS